MNTCITFPTLSRTAMFGISNASHTGTRPCVYQAQILHYNVEYPFPQDHYGLPHLRTVATLLTYTSQKRNNYGVYTHYSAIFHQSAKEGVQLYCGGSSHKSEYSLLAASVADAYNAAGIKFLHDFRDSDESDVIHAMLAVCEALGFNREHLFIDNII